MHVLDVDGGASGFPPRPPRPAPWERVDSGGVSAFYGILEHVFDDDFDDGGGRCAAMGGGVGTVAEAGARAVERAVPAVPAVPAGLADRADRADRAARAARAAEALRLAEQRTGARAVRAGGLVAVPGEGEGRADDEAAREGSRRAALLTTERPALPVPAALTPLLPEGLRRGGTTVVVGSSSLVLEMLARACAHGAWAAVVGQPSLGVLAAAQAGLDLARLAVVPAPGPDSAAVVAALLDGIDVVVVGPGAALTGADRRLLSARARERGTVLLATSPWPGAGVTLEVEAGRWTGLGDGEGRLRAHRLRVARTGRGVGPAAVVEVTLGEHGLEAPVPPTAGGDEQAAAGLRLVG